MIRFLFALCVACVLAGPATAHSFNAQEQAEIRAVVRDYLVANPDVLREALDALETRVRAERRQRAEDDERAFSRGPADAPITIVEFFDYRCPYCRAAHDWIEDVARSRRDVRVVYLELPILGPDSMEAARATIAAMPQGRYLQFHSALMEFNGELSSERINTIAGEAGIDVPRMRRAMNDPESGARIDQYVNEVRALAIDISGERNLPTPLFLINGQLTTGFRQAELDQLIRDARRQQAQR